MSTRVGDRVRDGVGSSTRRVDGVPKVKGVFAYGSDLWHEDMLWGATLRSPHPHARIRSVGPITGGSWIIDIAWHSSTSHDRTQPRGAGEPRRRADWWMEVTRIDPGESPARDPRRAIAAPPARWGAGRARGQSRSLR